MTPSLQRITGRFPGVGPVTTTTLQDTAQNGLGRSLGVQTISAVTSQPTITSPWTILSWSITYSMWLYSTGGPLSGKLGKLFGGLILGGTTSTPPGVPFNISTLPSDPTTIAQLWDGATDDTPPFSLTLGATAPANIATYSQQLPVPLLMAPSDKLGIGLWLTQMLSSPISDGNTISLNVDAGYAIEYTTGT